MKNKVIGIKYCGNQGQYIVMVRCMKLNKIIPEKDCMMCSAMCFGDHTHEL